MSTVVIALQLRTAATGSNSAINFNIPNTSIDVVTHVLSKEYRFKNGIA